MKLTIAAGGRAKRRAWIGASETILSLGIIANDAGATKIEASIKPDGHWAFRAKARGVIVLEAKGYSGPPPQFASLPDELRQRVLRKWGRQCFYCGSTGDGRLHIDHKMPIARGGTDDFDNLVPACQPCNLSKGAKLLEEWRPDAGLPV